jgi:hypothetical protein
MFEKTFTFWRRLVHRTPEASTAGVVATQDDRRLWLRYSADLNAQVRLENQGVAHGAPAKVRDLSMGGANLLVEMPFESGQLLTLELPTNDNTIRTVLACVVRSMREDAKQWSVGCVFSRELTEQELASFGAQRIRHDPEDQRTWKRFSCELKAQYQVVGDPENQTHIAQVLNISANGVGLQVTQVIEAGCLLSLDLLDREGHLIRSILSCVVHTTQRAGGELALGCNFIRELSEDELRSLV